MKIIAWMARECKGTEGFTRRFFEIVGEIAVCAAGLAGLMWFMGLAFRALGVG